MKTKAKGFIISHALGLGAHRRELSVYFFGFDEHGFTVFVPDPTRAHLFPSKLVAEKWIGDYQIPGKVVKLTGEGEVKNIKMIDDD